MPATPVDPQVDGCVDRDARAAALIDARGAVQGTRVDPLLHGLIDTLIAALGSEYRALLEGDLDTLRAATEHKGRVLLDLAPRLRAAPAEMRKALAPVLLAARGSNENNARVLAIRAVPHRARLTALLNAARGLSVTHDPAAGYADNGRVAPAGAAPQTVAQA
jgi:hypothetical protein